MPVQALGQAQPMIQRPGIETETRRNAQPNGSQVPGSFDAARGARVFVGLQNVVITSEGRNQRPVLDGNVHIDVGRAGRVVFDIRDHELSLALAVPAQANEQIDLAQDA